MIQSMIYYNNNFIIGIYCNSVHTANYINIDCKYTCKNNMISIIIINICQKIMKENYRIMMIEVRYIDILLNL